MGWRGTCGLDGGGQWRGACRQQLTSRLSSRRVSVSRRRSSTAAWVVERGGLAVGQGAHSGALLLRGKVNISQLQGEIEFNTFLCDKPYN